MMQPKNFTANMIYNLIEGREFQGGFNQKKSTQDGNPIGYFSKLSTKIIPQNERIR